MILSVAVSSFSLLQHMGKKGGIFRYADGADKLLMVFGTLGSIGDGLMTPLTMLVFSGLLNEYGASKSSLSNDTVDTVIANFHIFFL